MKNKDETKTKMRKWETRNNKMENKTWGVQHNKFEK